MHTFGSSGMWCLRMWCLIIIEFTLSYTYNLPNMGSHNYCYQTPHPQTPHPWTPDTCIDAQTTFVARAFMYTRMQILVIGTCTCLLCVHACVCVCVCFCVCVCLCLCVNMLFFLRCGCAVLSTSVSVPVCDHVADYVSPETIFSLPTVIYLHVTVACHTLSIQRLIEDVI